MTNTKIKILILFFSIINPELYGKGGTDTIQTKDTRKLLIGINISPDYCYRTLKNHDGSASSALINYYNNSETSKTGFTAGLNLCYNIKKQIGFESGIQFSSKGYQFFGSVIYWGSSGWDFATARLVYNHYYLDIPLKVNFTYGKKKLRLIASSGFVTNVFIKATSTFIVEYPDSSQRSPASKRSNNYKRNNLSPFISAGIDRRIKDKMSFRVETVLRYGILKIIEAPVTRYLWNFGINFSFYYALRMKNEK